MTDSGRTRREFLSTSAAGIGGGWMLLNLPLLTALAGCAREAALSDEPFENMSPEMGLTMQAFAARIIPSDDGTPGAAEAGAAWFVDAAIAGPFAGMADPVRAGLSQLDARARAEHGAPFHELSTARQDDLIRGFEETPFFFPLRMLTVIGVMADPMHGGNRDHAGWAVLGMEHAGGYQPPFGYYDAEAADQAGGVS